MNNPFTLETSADHIGAMDRIRPQDDKAIEIMAERLSKITGRPIEYCLKELGIAIKVEQ